MKIFHLGDLHIGKSVNGFLMIEDQKFVLNNLYEMIDEEKPHVVIIAGDIFDRSVPNVEAVELADEMFKKIAIDKGIPIIAIAGNHDGRERVEYLNGFAKHSGLYISGVLKKEIVPVCLQDEYGEVLFYPIPYAKPAVVRELFEDETIKNHDDVMKKITDVINQNIDITKRNVSIAHGHITTITANGVDALEESKSEKPLEIGGTDIVNADYFKMFNYTALGHLHGPQKVMGDKIRYSGSLLKYSFSEVNQKKAVTIVNLDKDGEIQITLAQFKPRRDMRIIRGLLKDVVENSVNDKKNKEDYIRVELEDTLGLIDPMSKLRSVYPHVMELGKADISNDSKKNITSNLGNIKEKDKLNLFKSFYSDVIGSDCEESKLKAMARVIEAVESEVNK